MRKRDDNKGEKKRQSLDTKKSPFRERKIERKSEKRKKERKKE